MILAKITDAQNEVALGYNKVRELFLVAVIFATIKGFFLKINLLALVQRFRVVLL